MPDRRTDGPKVFALNALPLPKDTKGTPWEYLLYFLACIVLFYLLWTFAVIP